MDLQDIRESCDDLAATGNPGKLLAMAKDLQQSDRFVAQYVHLRAQGVRARLKGNIDSALRAESLAEGVFAKLELRSLFAA